MAKTYVGDQCNIDQTFDSPASLMRALESISIPFNFIPTDNSLFQLRIRRRHHGAVIFAETYVSAPCISERSTVPGTAPEDYVCITAHTTGSHWFSMDGVEFAVHAGDVHVWSAQASCRALSPAAMGGKSIMVPRTLLDRRFGSAVDMCGRKAVSGEGGTQLLFSHLLNLHDSLDRLPKDKLSEVIGVTLDLLHCCLPDMPNECIGSSYHKNLFARCERFIRDNITDTKLSLSHVANHLGISTRSLQQLFTRADTTFSAFLRGERLKLAAHALEAPSSAKVSVTEVAHRFGFYDLAHFSRSFKARYTISPLAYRRRAVS